MGSGMSRKREHPAKLFTDEEILFHAKRVTEGGMTWKALAEELGCARETLSGRYRRITDPTHRIKDRERAKRGTAKRRAKIRALIYEARDRPCVDCGIELPPACMELDHVRGEKKLNLSVGWCCSGRAGRYFPISEVVEEIEKCEPRCPNCHRLRHYYEREDQAA